jgi:hypothetical protein
MTRAGLPFIPAFQMLIVVGSSCKRGDKVETASAFLTACNVTCRKPTYGDKEGADGFLELN